MPTFRGRRATLMRRAVQTLCMGLFLLLLCNASFPLGAAVSPPAPFVPTDLFLRLDPALALGLPLAARAWIPSLLPGLLVLLFCLVAGRIFCGYICPLGCTLDAVRWLGRIRVRPALPPALERCLPQGKILLLAGLLSAAALGVNLFFWGAPIPLVTRLYALVLDPLRLLLEYVAAPTGLALWDGLGQTALADVQIFLRRYDLIFLTAFLLSLILGLEYVRPRFWCRALCPAGAAMALASRLPLWRRRVRRCTQCGQCARHCPTAAIAPDGGQTNYGECLTCRACMDICPVQGVSFSVYASAPTRPPAQREPEAARLSLSLPSRRAFLAASGVGAVTGALHMAELRSPLRLTDEGRGLWQSPLAIRPPGALPEKDFLRRCVRCGQCMKACPTNGLQPAWLESGMAGCFSPVLSPRRGPCEPDCNVCGQVCPSAALPALPLAQKRWAKVGTAVIIPGRCLAWGMNKRCMVCQEVCPYGAIELVTREGAMAPVPVVLPQRCFGCGYCENHCPVQVPAVVVEAFQALRLSGGDYTAEGKAQGLSLDPEKNIRPPALNLGPGGLPPGFTE